MATHSTILAWRIPRTEEPVGLQSMGSQRIRHHWATSTRASHPQLALSFVFPGQRLLQMFEFVIPDAALGHKAGSHWLYVPAQKCEFCPLGYGEQLRNFYSIIQLIVCSGSYWCPIHIPLASPFRQAPAAVQLPLSAAAFGQRAFSKAFEDFSALSTAGWTRQAGISLPRERLSTGWELAVKWTARLSSGQCPSLPSGGLCHSDNWLEDTPITSSFLPFSPMHFSWGHHLDKLLASELLSQTLLWETLDE